MTRRPPGALPAWRRRRAALPRICCHPSNNAADRIPALPVAEITMSRHVQLANHC